MPSFIILACLASHLRRSTKPVKATVQFIFHVNVVVVIYLLFVVVVVIVVRSRAPFRQSLCSGTRTTGCWTLTRRARASAWKRTTEVGRTANYKSPTQWKRIPETTRVAPPTANLPLFTFKSGPVILHLHQLTMTLSSLKRTAFVIVLIEYEQLWATARLVNLSRWKSLKSLSSAIE